MDIDKVFNWEKLKKELLFLQDVIVFNWVITKDGEYFEWDDKSLDSLGVEITKVSEKYRKFPVGSAEYTIGEILYDDGPDGFTSMLYSYINGLDIMGIGKQYEVDYGWSRVYFDEKTFSEILDKVFEKYLKPEFVKRWQAHKEMKESQMHRVLIKKGGVGPEDGAMYGEFKIKREDKGGVDTDVSGISVVKILIGDKVVRVLPVSLFDIALVTNAFAATNYDFYMLDRVLEVLVGILNVYLDADNRRVLYIELAKEISDDNLELVKKLANIINCEKIGMFLKVY